jgi:hypothetical protein
MPVLTRVLLANGLGDSSPARLVRRRVEWTDRIVANALESGPWCAPGPVRQTDATG